MSEIQTMRAAYAVMVVIALLLQTFMDEMYHEAKGYVPRFITS